MRLVQATLLLAVAGLTAVATGRLAARIGDREARRQLERWAVAATEAATRPSNPYRPAPRLRAVEPMAFRRSAIGRARWNGWVVWAAAFPIGLGAGFLMGRGALHVGEVTVERGDVGCAF